MRFYLGTHEPGWLARLDIPLMVSRNRIGRFAGTARAPYVLDSGGFTELQQHGRWRSTAREYADELARIAETTGPFEWAAPQDWMCEPAVIHGGKFTGGTFAGTGLSVAEHQQRTVANYLELRSLGAPVIPVLQGFTLADYARCVAMYERAGVDLAGEPTVGLGSVCRREDTDEIETIVGSLISHGIALHGFGCKEGAIRRVGDALASADSMAWSKGGRRRGPCEHLKSRCANHLHYALEWREAIMSAPLGGTFQLGFPL